MVAMALGRKQLVRPGRLSLSGREPDGRSCRPVLEYPYRILVPPRLGMGNLPISGNPASRVRLTFILC